MSLALALLGGSLALLPPVAAQEAPAGGQTVDADLLRDLDLAFELRRPSDGWRLYDETEIARFHPDACAGMVHPGRQGFFVVIAEPAGGTSLAEYAELIFETTGLGELTVRSEERTTVAGEPAHAYRLSGEIDGMRFAYLVHVVVREGFAFQLVGWTLESRFAALEPELSDLAAGFAFLAGRSPRLRGTPVAAADQDGFDWRIRGPVYENASFGLRLDAGEGWRFMGGLELAETSPDACAGLVHRDPPIYQTWVVEPVHGIDRERFLAIVRAQQSAGVHPDAERLAERSIAIAGAEAREIAFGGIPMKSGTAGTSFATVFVDELCVQVHSWWAGVDPAEALAVVGESYGALSRLERVRRDALAAELARLDPDNAVGPRSSLRNGVFRDFELGWTYRLPEGLWRAKTGDAAAWEHEEAALVLEHPALGVWVVLVPTALNELEHREYHDSLCADAPGEIAGATRELEARDETFLVSRYDVEDEGVRYSSIVATAAADGLGIELLVYGLGASVDRVEADLARLAGGLELTPWRLSAVRTGAGSVEDARLGYRLRAPDETWTLEAHASLPEIASVASMASLEKDGVACIAFSICVPGSDDDLALQGLLASAGLQGLDRDEHVETPDVLAGLDARRVTIEGRRGLKRVRLDAWLARRANTLYCYLVTRERLFGPPGDGELARYKSCFSLLD